MRYGLQNGNIDVSDALCNVAKLNQNYSKRRFF